MRRRAVRRRGWLPAATYAVALHAALITLLVVGFRVVSRPTDVPTMQATVVRDPSPDLNRQEDERKRKEAETKMAEAERKRQEAIEQVRQENERRQQEEKKKQEQEQRKKEEAERKQQAEAEKRKEEQKKQAEQRKQAEQALREQLAEEEQGRSATKAARAARMAPEVDKYRAAIRQKVERSWVRPSSTRKGLQCMVRVRLIPGGEVLEVKIVRSSGDAVFDRSVENAVHKASPLPLPDNPELLEQFREIEFIFRPED
ncbi:MAG TPA: cell envelope integrity protein TolA [Burkholderiales bacterium]|nr:cell envelope integrity protein TolA [Burkholderiales bacterium]